MRIAIFANTSSAALLEQTDHTNFRNWSRENLPRARVVFELRTTAPLRLLHCPSGHWIAAMSMWARMDEKKIKE
jgi:hypothetical protein